MEDNFLKSLENYQEAEGVSIGKVMGNEALIFTEYLFKAGVRTVVQHEALPVPYSKLFILKGYSKELEKARAEHGALGVELQAKFTGHVNKLKIYGTKITEIQEKISKETGLKKVNQKKVDELLKEQEDLTTKMKSLGDKITILSEEVEEALATSNGKMEDVQLKIAKLSFERANPEITIDKIKEFIDPVQLQWFEYIALGQSIPPKLLPGGLQRAKRKNS